MMKILRCIKIFFVSLLLSLVSLFFVNTFAKIFVGEVLSQKGVDNCITEFLLCTVPEDKVIEDSVKPQIIIENTISEQDRWQRMYPFGETSFIADYCTNESLKKPVEEETITVTEKINNFAIKYIHGYEMLSKKLIHDEAPKEQSVSDDNKYFSITALEDGFLAEFKPKGDMTEKALAVKALAEYCEKSDCRFLYVQNPYKIDKYNDTDVSGIKDFSNQNQDSLIELLRLNGVTVLDFRELIHDAGLTRQDTFYRTDHHWLAETGFWASNQILKFLRKNYFMNVDVEIIDEANFDKQVFEDFFLGSQGKKVTLEKTKPEDFTLYYPKFDTKLKVFIPNMNIDEVGNFTLLYNMNSVSEQDFYGKNPYAAYSYGDQPLMQISNELIADDDSKILLIHDSFCDCVIPFLSLGIKNVHAIDLRHFTGSLETYIETEKPDIVIVSSVVSVGGKINWKTHTDSFDFR